MGEWSIESDTVKVMYDGEGGGGGGPGYIMMIEPLSPVSPRHGKQNYGKTELEENDIMPVSPSLTFSTRCDR